MSYDFLNTAKIAVLGSGTMGIGIVQLAILNQHATYLFDLDLTKSQQAVEGLKKTLNQLVEKGKYTQVQVDEALARLTISTDIAQLQDAQLVIEAIVERKDVKQSVFKQLAEICAQETIFASNTSSISITAISSTIPYTERVVGLHFFNPAPVMKLVEIVKGLKTPVELCEALKALMLRWNKVPVITKSTPGFIVNRIARPFYSEGFRALQDHVTSFEKLDYALRECGGFAMGPCELTDLIGQDVNFSVTQTVYQEFFAEPRYRPSLIQKELVDAGSLGRKSGQGFYQYDDRNQYERFTISSQTQASNRALNVKVLGQWHEDSVLKRFNLHIRQVSEVDEMILDDIHIRPSQGESAILSDQQNKLVLLDWHHDFAQAKSVVLSHNTLCLEQDVEKVEHWFTSQNIQVIWINDHPGLLTLRTIATLINEACEASLHNIASQDDIDQAMRYGVNYPCGPYTWLKKIGAKRILTTLQNLYEIYGEEKYRPSIYLKKLVAVQAVELNHKLSKAG